MAVEIIPSLLVDSEEAFEQRLRLVEGEVETVHVDILDGSMFSSHSWHDAEKVAAMGGTVRYELHLMVENPLPLVEAWIEAMDTVDRAIIHAEIERPPGAVMNAIRQKGLEAGIAVNPATPIEAIAHELRHADELLVMGVEPGASGKPFAGDQIYEKIERARNEFPSLTIGIDGAVTADRLPRFTKAGATRICAASAIFNAPDPRSALVTLLSAAST